MAVNVLVDTSIWIDFFRNKSLPTSQNLLHLLDNDHACTTGIVITELLRGARDEGELKRVRELLKPVLITAPQEKTWEEAGHLAYKLSKKGLTIYTVDAVIAAIAKENKLALFTTDKHFSQIATHAELNLYTF